MSAHDFDFLHGSWTVTHRKLRARLASCDEWDHFSGTLTCLSTSAGFGNMDDNWLDDPSGAYGAIAIRGFNPADRTWSIWWLDQRSPQHLDPPVVGSFADGVGTFVADDELAGHPIVVRFRWLDTATANPRWEQAFSADGGATWEVNWEMLFTPAFSQHAPTARRSGPLRAARALKELERIIAAALTTGAADDVTTPALVARATGRAVDDARIARFEIFARHLHNSAPNVLNVLPEDAPRRALLPFYEAYFSNFIEGTEFTLDEAAGIVFDGVIPNERPADAHDITGTYTAVADPVRNRETTRDPDEFCDLIRRWHREVMGGRPTTLPGEFKVRPNRAGSTEFVAPEKVRETLRRGFVIGADLIDPFHRAAYLMFLVAEVHPFVDGNGRAARIAMNAELSAAGQSWILIPILYRLDYVGALKAASRGDAFAPLVAVLAFAQRYTARVDFTDRASAEADLTRTNALRDPNEADDAGIRLTLP